jgi:hypothetical protein
MFRSREPAVFRVQKPVCVVEAASGSGRLRLGRRRLLGRRLRQRQRLRERLRETEKKEK